MGCPNCNGKLVPYRIDRQVAGLHVIILEWRICPSCMHVALERWTAVDGPPEPGPQYGRRNGTQVDSPRR